MEEEKKPRIKKEYKQMIKGTVFVAIMLAIFITLTDFLGIGSRITLENHARYINITPEIQGLADQIRQECSNESFPEFCIRVRALNAVPTEHTWFSSFEKPIQGPDETLDKQRGNCVDKSIFAASLFSALEFEHVYLVLQSGHECLLISDGTEMRFEGCIPESPIKGVLRVYSAGL